MELPLKSESLPNNIGKQQVDWLLPSIAKFDQIWMPKLILNEYTISYGGKSYPLLDAAEKHPEHEWNFPLMLIEQAINESVGNPRASTGRLQLRIRLTPRNDVLSICSELISEKEFFELVSDPVRNRFDSARKELVANAGMLADGEIIPLVEAIQQFKFLKSEPQELLDTLAMLIMKNKDLQNAEKDDAKLNLLKDIDSKATKFEKFVKQLAGLQKAKRDLSETLIESAHIYYEVFNSTEKTKIPVDVVKLISLTNQSQPAEVGAK